MSHTLKALRIVMATLLVSSFLFPSIAIAENLHSDAVGDESVLDSQDSGTQSGEQQGAQDQTEGALPPGDVADQGKDPSDDISSPSDEPESSKGKDPSDDISSPSDEPESSKGKDPSDDEEATPPDVENDPLQDGLSESEDPTEKENLLGGAKEDPEVPEMSVLAEKAAVVKDGLYSIVSSVNASLYFDVSSSDPRNGALGYLWKKNGQSNQVFDFERQGDGTYIIRAFHSDKVLAVSGLKAKNGASIVQWVDNKSANMRWQLQAVGGSYRIVSVDTGLCLDVASNTAKSGAQFVAWEITGSSKQLFNLVAGGKKKGAGKTLEAGMYSLILSDNGSIAVSAAQVDASASNGTGFKTQSSKKALAQKYAFTYHETDGCYTISNLASGKVLAVSGIQARNGASVVLWDDNGTANMRWSMEKAGNGYRLVSKDTSRCFDFAANSATRDASCVVWQITSSSKQVFTLKSVPLVEDGYYAISPMRSTKLRVDVNGSSTVEGTPTILWSVNGALSQKFHFIRNGNGTYTIKTLHSGQYLGISSNGKIAQLRSNQPWTVGYDGAGGIRLQAKAADGSVKAFSTEGGVSSSAAVLAQASNASNKNQSFSFTPVNIVNNGLYTISAKGNSKLILSQHNASSANGTTLNLAQDGELPWSKYTVKNISNNVVSITTSNNKSLAVDASAGAGAHIVQWDSNGTDNMKWKVTPDYNGSVFLTNVQTGMNIDYDSDFATAGDPIVAWTAHWGDKQKWTFSQTLRTSGAQAYYDMTLSEILAYQMTNPYISENWQTVVSYLDPDALKTKPGGYYAFASIKGYSGLTAAQLDKYIESTTSGRSGNLKGMGKYFVSAAKKYNLNEMYLLSHAIIESNWGTSTLARGYLYDGKTFIEGKRYPAETYYNFYGIGAVDSSPLSGGRSMAIQNGWNSPQAAIEGAAYWIMVNYVNRSDYSQTTLYDMRWDPARSEDTGKRSWHQYATSITWASSIGRVMQLGYQYCGVAPKLTFIIPVYK